MPIFYPEFGDFCDVAADVLATSPERIARLPNVGLAESALAALRAGFGDVETYPTLLEKAAILLERLARNHPLPDGNKCTAFFLTGLFLEANGSPLAKSSSTRSWRGFQSAPHDMRVGMAMRPRHPRRDRRGPQSAVQAALKADAASPEPRARTTATRAAH